HQVQALPPRRLVEQRLPRPVVQRHRRAEPGAERPARREGGPSRRVWRSHPYGPREVLPHFGRGDDAVPIGVRITLNGKCPIPAQDRKSTRLNSSHQIISYAVFRLKKTTISRSTSACRASSG